MQFTFQMIGWWILLSFTLGPCLTWAFFYPERRSRAARADYDHWIATHSTTSRDLMPAWIRWEDTTEEVMSDDEAPDLHQAGVRHY